MDRIRLEALATYLAVVIVGVLILFCIVATADGVFDWDLLPPFLDKVAVLAMSALFIVLGAAVLTSIMLNVSIIASKLTVIAERSDGDVSR